MSLVLPVIMVYLAEDRRELFTLCELGRACHAGKAASERVGNPDPTTAIAPGVPAKTAPRASGFAQLRVRIAAIAVQVDRRTIR
jgi:hypothetical protein